MQNIKNYFHTRNYVFTYCCIKLKICVIKNHIIFSFKQLIMYRYEFVIKLTLQGKQALKKILIWHIVERHGK